MRKYRPICSSNHVLSEAYYVMEEVPEANIIPTRKKKSRNEGTSVPSEIQFIVFCLCWQCELHAKPTPRLLFIVKVHIESHGMEIKYKVTY